MQSDETATAYLHRVYRHIKRARFGRSGNGRLRRIAKRTAAPIYWHVHPIVQAAAEVRSSYSLIKSSYGIGLLRQIAGSIAFSTSFRVPPTSYFDYRLFLRERRPLRSHYLYPDEFWVLLEWLSEELGPRDAFDLNDKRRFHDRVSRVGLPTIPILAEFDRGEVRHRCRAADYPASDLFSKFANRLCGEGALLWRRLADGFYSHNDGSDLPLGALHETLTDQSFVHPVILQPRIINHCELGAISGNALSTVRVVTARETTGQIDVAVACFRMAVGSQVADNFAVGGLASPVGLDDGRLGSAVFKLNPGIVTAHPDSGAIIAGRTLPHWVEVKRLAVAAHREFKTLPSIGWDFAITEDGPVIVEGNVYWDANIVQLAHQKPLAATSIPVLIAEYFDQLAEARGLPRAARRR